ncbi:ubiquitin-related domain-containing protein [Mycena epipterygia]|nr:ubiquitin-related domain-containing protein [Mycena epipterygia]
MAVKLTIKTTQQKVFQIDAELTDTVAVLKEKIQSAHGHPTGVQKIIYSGKILSDDKTVESCGVKKKDFLVLMVLKPKPTPTPMSAASSSTPAPVLQEPAPAPQEPAPALAASAPAETPSMTSDSLPFFPSDLEREIFETAAELYPDTIPSLLLVSQRVNEW